MLTELIEFSHKMKEEMKATQSEIKENVQGTKSEGKETRTPTTKELKMKHSSTMVGGVEEMHGKVEASGRSGSWQARWSHICVQINWEEQLGSKTGHANEGSNVGK